jgi:MYXO-CTERM domain-containing protein
MKRLFLKATVLGAGIMLAGSAKVRGDVLYQDTTQASGQVLNLPNEQEIGQQIWLGSPVPMYLTNFSFEYYSPNIFYGSVYMDVRLYENNGSLFNGYASPGTVFFDSGYFNLTNPWYIDGTNAANVIFGLSDLLSGNVVNLDQNAALPSNFTLSVTVTNLGSSYTVGLPIFGLATVGTNAGDYWYESSGSWQLLTNNMGPVAFGTEFLGQTTPTPEPSVLGLGALGAAVLTLVFRRRQRRG